MTPQKKVQRKPRDGSHRKSDSSDQRAHETSVQGENLPPSSPSDRTTGVTSMSYSCQQVSITDGGITLLLTRVEGNQESQEQAQASEDPNPNENESREPKHAPDLSIIRNIPVSELLDIFNIADEVCALLFKFVCRKVFFLSGSVMVIRLPTFSAQRTFPMTYDDFMLQNTPDEASCKENQEPETGVDLENKEMLCFLEIYRFNLTARNKAVGVVQG